MLFQKFIQNNKESTKQKVAIGTFFPETSLVIGSLRMQVRPQGKAWESLPLCISSLEKLPHWE